VRATLHDELMREAGFESDYYRELARRRELRRTKLRRDVLRSTRIAAFIGAVAAPILWILDVGHKTDHLPGALVVTILAVVTIGGAAGWLEDRLTREEGERRPRRGLFRVWMGITHPHRTLLRAWRGITRPWRSSP
jgi:hypothetical protein